MLLFAAPGFAQPYHAIDLGTLDGTPTSLAFGLNNAGLAVGATNDADANLRGVLWDGTLMIVPPLAGDSQSHAFGINDAEQIVAMSFDLGELNPHGLLWDAGAVTDLGPLAPRSINSLGAIAGYWSTSTAAVALVDRAARWQNGSMTDLGTLGGNFSYAAAVSNWGQVVGWSYATGDAVVRAALWQNGSAYDLGTLGGASSQAYDISRESGFVVGVAETAAGQPHAFRAQVNAAGQVTSRVDLGELGGGNSYAYGVNNAGQVVGTSDARAFRWDAGTMTDLNTLLLPGADWRLECAREINDAGQIVGTGVHVGQTRGFLLAQVGDLEADGDVELSDFAQFALCLGGPGVTDPPPTCSAWDFAMSDADGDEDADLADYLAFQFAYPHP